jgi:hypothetical protein
MDLTKLMKFDEYNKTRWPRLYPFIFEKDGQFIYYFGSKHSYDPTDPQFKELEKFWNEFLDKTKDKKRIVFEEGGSRPFIEDRTEAILKLGEMGFVVNLAKIEGVDRFSPEPPEKFRFNELLKYFSKDEIAYHEFAREVYQWDTMLEKPDFDMYINNFLAGDKKGSGWEDYEFTVPHMIEIQKNIFGTEFDKNAKEFFYSIINPTTKKSIINKIARFEDDEFRDKYILEQIEKYWNDGFNIFAIYGSGHAIRQELAIKTL